jgi:hypothetical protein
MIDPNTGKVMTHKQYLRWAVKQRRLQNANAHTRSYRRVLLAFGLFVVIFVLVGIGAGLLWLVNR